MCVNELEFFSRRSVPCATSSKRTMAMEPPKPKMGVDPVRSRDIMDDIVNVVRTARAFAPRRLPIPRLRAPRTAAAFKNKRSPPGSPD